MTYETLILDLDGTISDPFEGISKSVNFALESNGFGPVDPEAIRPMIGPPLNEIFSYLLGDVAEPVMLELVGKYRERYAAVGYAENTIYKGVFDVVVDLSGRGYRLGVCTSKRADYAGKIVDLFGLGPYFQWLSGGDVGIGKKDQIAGLVADGLEPAAAIMIGDRAVDISAARQSGMDAVGVTWGFGDLAEISGAAPLHVADDPQQLLRLFPDER